MILNPPSMRCFYYNVISQLTEKHLPESIAEALKSKKYLALQTQENVCLKQDMQQADDS